MILHAKFNGQLNLIDDGATEQLTVFKKILIGDLIDDLS